MIPSTPMTVVGLKVDSFKRLRAAQLTPTPTGLVPVRGRNAQGKSSLIESMMAALLGKRAMPELPISEGAHGADVIVDLGEIVVRRRWKRDSAGKAQASLTIEAADGTRIASPQAVLDNLVGRAADPAAFLAMKPDEQVRTVLGVLGLDAKLAELEDRARGQYDQRRDVGREATRTAQALAQLEVELQGLAPSPPAGELDRMTAELAAAKDRNAGIAMLQSALATCVRAGQETVERIKAADARIAELQRELGEAEGYRADLQARTGTLRADWEVCTEKLNGQQQIDVAPIVQRISEHEAALRAAGKREQLEQVRREAHAAKAEHETVEASLLQTREAIGQLLGSATFPIEGMAYDYESKTLTIGGIPFTQASQAERIKSAAAVAMAGEPQIRVLFARDGSMLDDESRALLAKLAEERGFQLWLEIVDSTREGAGVWIENGEAFEEGA